MQCPNCHHLSGAALAKCSNCGETYDRETLEKFERLDFLLHWLDGHANVLGSAHARLRDDVLSQLNSARAILLPAQAAKPQRPAKEIARELALAQGVSQLISQWWHFGLINANYVESLRQSLATYIANLKSELEGQTVSLPQVSELEINDYGLALAPDWRDADLIPRNGRLIQHLTARHNELTQVKAEPAAPSRVPGSTPPERIASAPVSAKPIASAPVKPIAPPPPPPQPTTPPIDWANVWSKAVEFVVSGALLRSLLYLGAFMIVVSAIVIAVVYWELFSPALRVALIVALPLSFYAGGFFVRAVLKIPIAGTVITGIGAMLVAVDFVALYQVGGLENMIDRNVYWLIASLLSACIYFFTASRIPHEFFGYISLIAISSTTLALTQVARLSLDWGFAAASAAGIAVVEIAVRAKVAERWSALISAAKRYPFVILPITQLLVLFVPGNAALGQMATFAVAALGYALLTRYLPVAILVYASVVSSLVAGVFGLRAGVVKWEWYATVMAAASPAYLFASQMVAQKTTEAFSLKRQYIRTLDTAGLGLLTFTIPFGIAALTANVWASVIALTMASVVLAWCAHLFKRSLFAFAASALFVVPFSTTVVRVLLDNQVPQVGAWLMSAWTVLALVYLGVALALRAKEKYALWINFTAHLLTLFALPGLFINYALAPRDWNATPTLVALTGMLLVYIVSGILHDSGKYPALSDWVAWLPQRIARAAFLYPIGALIPAWIALLWNALTLDYSWLGVAFATLALGYVGAGMLLARRAVAYRLPPHLYAYLLTVVAIIVAAPNAWAQLTTLYLVVAVFTALAFVYRRPLETTIGALVALWAFQLSLQQSPLTPHVYSLGYALLASLVYIPLGIRLNKISRQFALPLYVIGYAVAAYAVYASLLGRFGFYPENLPWVGVVVPLIVTALTIYSAYHFNRRAFGWAAVAVFSMAYAQMHPLINLAPEYYAAGWVALAYAYVLGERALNRVGKAWLANFYLPLKIGALAFWMLGLGLTAVVTTRALSGFKIEDYAAPMVAQLLAVGLTILVAIMYRRRIPLFVEPALAFFPVTLFILGYTALTLRQYALVWMGLAALHLVAAAIVDRARVRYSHGLYLGGYAMAIFALAWSAADRLINLYTLAGLIVIALASHLLVHLNRHITFSEVHGAIWRRGETVPARLAKNVYLFFAAYAFPIWLMQLTVYFNVPLAWRGFALAAVAPIYIALGLMLRRARADYAWSFYSAAYALTALGAMIAFEDELVAIYVLVFDAMVYAASAYIFRQAFWLYVSNALVPVIAVIAFHYANALTATNIAGTMMGLAFAYVVIGLAFERFQRSVRAVGSFALPFFALGYLLSAVAMAVGSADKFTALSVFSASIVLFAFSAWWFRESVFLYSAVWLVTVPYWIGMTLTALPKEWYGIGWLPLIVIVLAIGRIAFHRQPLRAQSSLGETFAQPALPFYILGYALSAHMIYLSFPDGNARAWSFGLASVIYFGSAALFRRAFWLYPALLALHLAALATLANIPSNNPPYFVSVPMMGVTWVVALTAYGFSRASRDESFAKRLMTPSWAQPFLIFAFLDVLLWQSVSLYGLETAQIVATGFALLLALLTTLWRDKSLAYGAQGFASLALASALAKAGIAFADAAAIFAGVGLGVYLIVRAVEKIAPRALQVWGTPLTRGAVAMNALAILLTLPTWLTNTTASALALGCGGALYLAIAFRGKYHRLGYFAVALLELAWILLLWRGRVQEPQWYAIPTGLYLMGMGFFERRRGNKRFGSLIESLGLAVLLLTAFIQSLNGAAGFPYFLLLLAEGLLVIWWGAARRIRIPFFAGIAAMVLNVVAQVAVLVNVYDVNRFLAIFAVGLLLVVIAVFVERQRALIIAKAQEWREILETWE